LRRALIEELELAGPDLDEALHASYRRLPDRRAAGARDRGSGGTAPPTARRLRREYISTVAARLSQCRHRRGGEVRGAVKAATPPPTKQPSRTLSVWAVAAKAVVTSRGREAGGVTFRLGFVGAAAQGAAVIFFLTKINGKIFF
jgi:hypothetical protein